MMKKWRNKTANNAAYLDERHFLSMLLAAAFLHLAIFGIWTAVPSSAVVGIPVRVLNIKLGEGEENALAGEVFKQPTDNNNARPVESVLKRSFDNQPVPAKIQAGAVNALDKIMKDTPMDKQAELNDKSRLSDDVTSMSSLEQVARQFVRDRKNANNLQNLSPAAGGGSVLGNSTEKDAEALKRYEQLIAAWIQRYKVYPEEAKRQNMQGDGVVRVRIDRQGNIQYRIIEKRTGSQLLDKAILDMVQKANPVPPVPEDYPREGQMFEFLIPVSFKIR